MNPLFKALTLAGQGPLFAPSNPQFLQRADILASATGVAPLGFGRYKLELNRAENTTLLLEGYEQNHIVYTVMDWKAMQFAKSRPRVNIVENQVKLAKYKSLSFEQKLNEYTLRKNALTEVEDDNDDYVRLLMQPNPLQNWSQYAYACCIYFDSGNTMSLALRYDTGPKAATGQIMDLIPLPSNLYMGHSPDNTGYNVYVHVLDPRIRLDGKDVMHIRRFNARQGALTPVGTLWGMSRLFPAQNRLAVMQGSLEAEAEMMANRGSRTIIFPDAKVLDLINAADYTGDQASIAMDEIRRKLAQTGAGGIAGNSIPLSSINIGSSPIDLNIEASQNMGKDEVCALFHLHPLSVFGAKDTSSLGGNKEEEANKQSLRTGILPDLDLFFDSINNFVTPTFNSDKRKYLVDYDPNCYPELRPDLLARGQALTALGVPLTGNQRLMEAGLPQIDIPEMNVPYIPTGYQPVKDLLAVQDTGVNEEQGETGRESQQDEEAEGNSKGNY